MMHAIGIVAAICGCIVSIIGNSVVRRSYLRRTEQPLLHFDASQWLAWRRNLNASETRNLFLVQAISALLFIGGFAIATGAFG